LRISRAWYEVAGAVQIGSLDHALKAEDPVSGLIVAADLAATESAGAARNAVVETGRTRRSRVEKGRAIRTAADIGAEIAAGPAIGEGDDRRLGHQRALRQVRRIGAWLSAGDAGQCQRCDQPSVRCHAPSPFAQSIPPTLRASAGTWLGLDGPARTARRATAAIFEPDRIGLRHTWDHCDRGDD
jgi:hypothetical protein